MNEGGWQKRLDSHRVGSQFEACNAIVLCSWPTDSLTSSIMMSVRLVVFSIFHPKTLDSTAKPGPMSRPFVPGCSLPCLFTHCGTKTHHTGILKHVQAYWYWKSKKKFYQHSDWFVMFATVFLPTREWFSLNSIIVHVMQKHFHYKENK